MSIAILIMSLTRCVSISRSSRSHIFYKIGVLKNFVKFIGKHLCRGAFLTNWRIMACNFIKRETLAKVLTCECHEFLRTTFLQKNLRETASAFLFKFCSIDLLILVARFWSSARKCFYICWILMHFIAICFWQHNVTENSDLPLG